MNYIIKITIVSFCVYLFSSCKKLIEVDPPYTSFTSANVYATDATAISAVTSIYVKMNQSINVSTTNGLLATSYFLGLSSDDFGLYQTVTGTAKALHINGLSGAEAPTIWTCYYPIVYQANAAIEALTESTLTEGVKKQLLGEVKFVRAFCYFYLVNLYGDVPLVLSTDYKVNSLMARTSASAVWQQIITDLKDAQTLLSEKYPKSDLLTFYTNGAEERIRPTKWAATAMLARAYLYQGDWAKADSESTSIIGNSGQYSLATINSVFLKNNTEAIWQLQQTTEGTNSFEALFFVIPSTGFESLRRNVYINNSLLNSFEPSDQRKTNWLGSIMIGSTTYYYPYKYKVTTFNLPVTERSTLLRLSELFLIRAEARAQLGNITGSQNDINAIRARTGLSLVAANDKTSLLAAILRERRVEFFSEWGHRWLDLKRTNTVDAVMPAESILKGGVWDAHDKFYPISNTELLINPSLTQTSGY